MAMTDAIAKPNKRALLIGINEYPNLPSYSQLRGCVNDIQIMKDLLEKSFDFPPANITVLLNEQATEKGILEAQEQLVAECGEGDIVVFHYSGHGSQMAAQGDKPRGYDESIMPYDSGRMNSGFPVQVEPRDIRDTQIRDWLFRLSKKTANLTLVFDSCHSGSITRMVGDSEEEGTKLRWIPPDPLPMGVVPPADSSAERGVSQEAAHSGWLPAGGTYVLLAACAADQGAYELDHEHDGQPLRNGAFTFFLTQEIIQSTGESPCTYQDIWEKVATKVNNRFQKQTPQLEGARDKQLFDVQDIAPMRYLLVQERQDGEVTLSGGEIHGLTVGSRWEIYPAGTKQTNTAQAQRQGTVKITSVGALTSKAKITEENPPKVIIPDARAVEILHAEAATLMPVWFAPAPRGHQQAMAELRKTLTQSKLLKKVGSAAEARVQIRISSQNEVAGQSGREAMWTILDSSETPLMHRYPVAAPESKFKIKDNLEIIWRYEKVLELRNEKSALKGKVDFLLLKKKADGSWQEITESEGAAVYRSGDSIAFRVINRSEVNIYASVLDFGLSKQIALLHPPSSASEEIGVKRSGGDNSPTNARGILSVGESARDEIELVFPDNLTFLAQSIEGQPLLGKEYFKLIVTTQRHDLRFLTQAGLREESIIKMEHPLERLTYLAITSGLTRETRRKLEPQDEWFTIERLFFLQK